MCPKYMKHQYLQFTQQYCHSPTQQFTQQYFFFRFPVSKGEAYSLTKMPVLTMTQKYHNIHSVIYQIVCIVFDRGWENIIALKQ